LWLLTLKCAKTILVSFLCLEYASGLPAFSFPSFPGIETQDISSVGPSTPVSDREKAGLRGPAKTCIEENSLPDGTKYSTASEYNPDGRLLTTRMLNPDGSEWLTTHTYRVDGRLAKIVSGKPGEPGSETLYAYNEAGEVLAITNNGEKGGRTDFHYDEQHRKTSIQYFDPKVLERAQNSVFSGSPWDAAFVGIGVPAGGSLTTIYDESDQPTEAQIHDAAGRLVSRLVRKYDANGRLVEEEPIQENPALFFAERFAAEGQPQPTAAQLEAMNTVMKSLLRGRSGTGTSYIYDEQGRISKTHDRNFAVERITMIIYNDQGDKAEERTTLTENSIIPVGVSYAVDENGVLAQSKPAVEPQEKSHLPELSEVHYAYQYDSHGNWTQQTANYLSSGVASSQARSRKLTYY